MGGLESLSPNFPKALLFDLDGTLVDSLPGIEGALRHAFDSIGLPFPSGSLRDAIGPPIRVIAGRLAPHLSDAQTTAIEADYRRFYDETAWRQTVAFPGVLETLRYLATSGSRLFVATNKPRIPASKILGHLGMTSLFEDVLTRDSQTPHFSDKAALLRHLMAKHKLDPRDAAMIGDTSEDGHAAIANDVRFIFMTYGYGEWRGASDRFDCFADLMTFRHVSGYVGTDEI